jgi:hypothetical protein
MNRRIIEIEDIHNIVVLRGETLAYVLRFFGSNRTKWSEVCLWDGCRGVYIQIATIPPRCTVHVRIERTSVHALELQLNV